MFNDSLDIYLQIYATLNSNGRLHTNHEANTQNKQLKILQPFVVSNPIPSQQQ